MGTGSNFMLALPGKKEPLPSSALSRKLSGESFAISNTSLAFTDDHSSSLSSPA